MRRRVRNGETSTVLRAASLSKTSCYIRLRSRCGCRDYNLKKCPSLHEFAYLRWSEIDTGMAEFGHAGGFTLG
jgi:hypothetical protein